MSEIILDIECDGLKDTLTKIWVIGIKDVESGTCSFYSDEVGVHTLEGSLRDGVQRIKEADRVIGHNIIDYDYPILEKLLGVELDYDKIFDTLVVSRVLNPDRRKPSGYTGKSGPHSLDAWGCRVGKAKPKHDTWDVFDSAMLRRNRGDLEVNNLVYSILRSEIKGHSWDRAIKLEQKVQRIITRQSDDGVYFDLTRANGLLKSLDGKIKHIDDELLPNLPKSCKSWGTTITKPFKNNGSLLKRVVEWFDRFDDCSADVVCGPFTRIDWIEMNLGSMPQVKAYLLSQGWQPTEYNYNDDGERTSPKITEDSYGTITGNLGQLVKDRMLYRHRRSQIQGWVDRVRSDGRLSAGANTCGTNTRRFRHSNVVNVPKAKDYVFLGKEMRSLFCAPKGRRFIGHDASALEARMLAHYAGSEKLIKMILESDIHSANVTIMSLNSRDEAKTLYYALLYGSSDEKLGEGLGWEDVDPIHWKDSGEWDRAIARLKFKKGELSDFNICCSCRGYLLKKSYFREIPEIESIIKKAKKASEKGWLRGLDGSRIWMRRGRDGKILKHKALNTLLQSAGAIVMKESMVILDKAVRAEELDVIKVIDMHDEAQAEVALKDCKRYMELAEWSLVKAGENLKVTIPMAAEAKMGKNWGETHE